MGEKPYEFNVTEAYDNWYKTLTEVHLPLLRGSLSSVASTKNIASDDVTAVRDHILSFYEILERDANETTIAHLLSTSWHDSLETPFLLLGDIHPNLLTNILRSFFYPYNQEHRTDAAVSLGMDRSSGFFTAWEGPCEVLKRRTDEIECSTSMMVHALMERIRSWQRDYVCRVSINWIASRHSQEDRNKKTLTETTIDEGLTKQRMEELLKIFVDTNRLRMCVIMNIFDALTPEQATIYLEALCQILVGLKDEVYTNDEKHGPKVGSLLKLAKQEEKDKRDNRLLLTSCMGGTIAVPSYFVLKGVMSRFESYVAMGVFLSALYGAALSSFNGSMTKGLSPCRSIKDALWGIFCYFVGGLVLFIGGLFLENRFGKVVSAVIVTACLFSMFLCIYYRSLSKQERKKLRKNLWIVGFVNVVAIAFHVAFADLTSHLRKDACKHQA